MITKVPASIRWAQGVLIFQILLSVAGILAKTAFKLGDQYRLPPLEELCIMIVGTAIVLYSIRKPSLGARVPVGTLVLLIVMVLCKLEIPVWLPITLLFLAAPNSWNYMKKEPAPKTEE